MDEIFKLAYLQKGPLTAANYLDPLNRILRTDEVPATVTTRDVEVWQEVQRSVGKRVREALVAAGEIDAEAGEQAKAEEADELKEAANEEEVQEEVQEEAQEEAQEEVQEEEDEEEAAATGTTPLHALCASIPPTVSGGDLDLVLQLIDTLFEWGAGWMILDENGDTPGCIALRRGLPKEVYRKFVLAGTRAEVFLRKMESLAKKDELPEPPVEKKAGEVTGHGDSAVDQEAYLASDLTYTDNALVTTDHQDGVMMDWETPIMQRSAAVLTTDSAADQSGPIVLNVGFGMGIIDTFIQSLNPKEHYICEAHPDVLAKMRRDGWYDKPGVHVLEGKWKDTLSDLLSKGNVYFDGMYYDTFSEHYTDLVDFFDCVVGLLKPTGTCSFFNGLGADRQICYDVYCEVVEIDLAEYGLEVKYEDMPIAKEVAAKEDGERKEGVWKGIRKQYWAIDVYKFPHIKFMGA